MCASVTRDEKTHLTLRIEREVADELTALAEKNERSVSAELRVAIRRHIETQREAEAA